MKEILTLTEDYKVVLNPWVVSVPEFKKVIDMDKGTPGDYRGDKKQRATKQLAFVHYMVSFTSPILDWEPDERKLEAFRYTGLTDADITPEVEAAGEWLDKFQHESARSLRTLKAVKKSLNGMDAYFDTLNFSDVDKLGRLKNSTKEYLGNVSMLSKAYEAVDDFERRVYAELKVAVGTGVRGKNSKLGDKEGSRTEWNERGNPKKSKVSMVDLENVIQAATSAFTYKDEEVEADKEVPDGVS